MKKLLTTLSLMLAVLIGSTGCTTNTLISFSGVSGGRLPPCLGNTRSWTNCNGFYHLSDGSKYRGEIKDQKPNGRGFGTFVTPHKAAGEKQDGQFKEGIVQGIQTASKALEVYFPWESNDTNELSDSISKGADL